MQLTSPPIDPSFRNRQESTISLLNNKPGERTAVHENIASADLQNPSDALEILAQVADRAEDGDSPSSGDQNQGQSKQQQIRPTSRRQDLSPSKTDDYLHYKPVQDGMISPEMIYHLFSSYEEFFHPFFPIIPRETFDRHRLPWLSRHEPHLFSAILTVASKDNERVHQVCYDHMQQLISMILAGADANVEAVEALLLLSQWVSHRPQASIAVGRGEEDRVAWMYIGTALRLGYFLGIDRTAFKSDSHEDPAVFNRKRLVWSACYICDRQVSVRLGRGFWARGPGPLSGLKSSDFPTLQPLNPNADNYALIFQANLELTQIFSNVHDILYASKGHGWKEMLEGRYAKYLDDFRTSIRSWNDIWGTLICECSNMSSWMEELTSHRFCASESKLALNLRLSPPLCQCIRISSHNISSLNIPTRQPTHTKSTNAFNQRLSPRRTLHLRSPRRRKIPPLHLQQLRRSPNTPLHAFTLLSLHHLQRSLSLQGSINHYNDRRRTNWC